MNPPPTNIPIPNNHPNQLPNPPLSTSPKVTGSSGVYNKPLPPIPTTTPPNKPVPPPLPQKKPTMSGTYVGTVESDNSYDASNSSSFHPQNNQNNLGMYFMYLFLLSFCFYSRGYCLLSIATNRSRSLSQNTSTSAQQPNMNLYPSLSLSASFSTDVVSPRNNAGVNISSFYTQSSQFSSPNEIERKKIETHPIVSSPSTTSSNENSSKDLKTSKEKSLEHSQESLPSNSNFDPSLAKFLETHGLSKYLPIFEKVFLISEYSHEISRKKLILQL